MIDTPNKLKPAYRIKQKPKKLASKKLATPHQYKEQLMKEMLELDTQRQGMESQASNVDFAMLQTTREMIQSRRALLSKIERSID